MVKRNNSKLNKKIENKVNFSEIENANPEDDDYSEIIYVAYFLLFILLIVLGIIIYEIFLQ